MAAARRRPAGARTEGRGRAGACRARAPSGPRHRAGVRSNRAARGTRWRAAAPRSESRCGRLLPLIVQLALLFCRGERGGDLIEVALNHLVELVQGQVDAVVGDPVLLEVVGADLLGTVPVL